MALTALALALVGCGGSGGPAGPAEEAAAKPQPPAPMTNPALAFTYKPGGTNGGAVLCLMTSDGKTRKQLTQMKNGSYDNAAAWSSDGGTIAFVHTPGPCLSTIQADGAGGNDPFIMDPRHIRPMDGDLDWVPGVPKLLYCSDDGDGTIYTRLMAVDLPSGQQGPRYQDLKATLNLEESGIRQRIGLWGHGVGPDTDEGTPGFQGLIAYSTVTGPICVIRVATDAPSGLLVRADGRDSGPTAALLGWGGSEPDFSHDAGSIAFTDTANPDSGLWRVSITDTGTDVQFGIPVPVDDGQAAVGRPTWSPDGEWIAFGACYLTGPVTRYIDLWRTPVAGGSAVEMTQDPSTRKYDMAPDWNPAWQDDIP